MKSRRSKKPRDKILEEVRLSLCHGWRCETTFVQTLSVGEDFKLTLPSFGLGCGAADKINALLAMTMEPSAEFPWIE